MPLKNDQPLINCILTKCPQTTVLHV